MIAVERTVERNVKNDHQSTLMMGESRKIEAWGWQDLLPPKTGVLLCAHGSRDFDAVAECEAYVQLVRERAGVPVTHGYLEFAQPVIADALKEFFAHTNSANSSANSGANSPKSTKVESVIALPMMLLAAGHVKNDLPSVLRDWGNTHRRTVTYGAPVGLTPLVISLAVSRITACLTQHGVEASEAMLVVIGRGTTDPDANADVYKLARLLAEGLGVRDVDVGFSGVTFPSVSAALEKTARLGGRHIVVYEHFLFQGVLISRIQNAIAQARTVYPSLTFLDAGYLGATSDTALLMDESLRAVVEGRAVMNCQMCKYRTALPSFEHEVQSPQISHHQHVEGIGVGRHAHDHSHGHDHSHAHDHSHDHTHAPYRHADHMWGSRKKKADPL